MMAGPEGFEPSISGSAGVREITRSLSVLIRSRLRALKVDCGLWLKNCWGSAV